MEIKNKDQLPDSSSPLKVYRNVKVRFKRIYGSYHPAL